MQDLWIVDFIPKATGSQWRICKKKVKRLDLFFRAQSAVCGSCSLPAYSCQTLCNPADGSPPAPLSMEFSRQEYWSGFPFSSFILLLHSVPLLTLFLFQSLFILLMLGLHCCEWAFSSCSCSARASHCSGFSFWSTDSRVRASIVMARRV